MVVAVSEEEVPLEPLVDFDERLIMRKLLIISVGSSASIHLLRSICSQVPEILFEDEIVIVETSRDMLHLAIKGLSAAFQEAYVRVKKKRVSKDKFPTTAFEGRLKENAILLAEHGGATTPERGASYYSQKRNTVLQKIENIVSEREISGIVVIGCTGKGTGTLVTPMLLEDLIAMSDEVFPHPLGFITIPYRFFQMDISNCAKAMKYVVENDIRCFLIDYEQALMVYRYTQGREEAKKGLKIKADAIWKLVVRNISTVLSTLIDALNFGQYCSPPIDWSDLLPMYELQGTVGTVMCVVRDREEDLMREWRDTLDNSVFLMTKTKPSETRGMTIVRSGAGVSIDFLENIDRYYTEVWNSKKHLTSHLTRGRQFTVATLLYGFDPLQIVPPIEYRKESAYEKIKRALGIG
ncbi:MAG: hypothetical protein DRG31_02380 [Deltaproteobacteria bacterium]|nr:MAG: hypothetical protein DRG31_02380 [Deltaproteobacteria bacterium]